MKRLFPIAALLLAGCGLFLGLSALTVGFLRGERIDVPFVPEMRALLLAGASLWTLRLAYAVAGLSDRGPRQIAATAAIGAATALSVAGWVLMFWIW